MKKRFIFILLVISLIFSSCKVNKNDTFFDTEYLEYSGLLDIKELVNSNYYSEKSFANYTCYMVMKDDLEVYNLCLEIFDLLKDDTKFEYLGYVHSSQYMNGLNKDIYTSDNINDYFINSNEMEEDKMNFSCCEFIFKKKDFDMIFSITIYSLDDYNAKTINNITYNSKIVLDEFPSYNCYDYEYKEKDNN